MEGEKIMPKNGQRPPRGEGDSQPKEDEGSFWGKSGNLSRSQAERRGNLRDIIPIIIVIAAVIGGVLIFLKVRKK